MNQSIERDKATIFGFVAGACKVVEWTIRLVLASVCFSIAVAFLYIAVTW